MTQKEEPISSFEPKVRIFIDSTLEISLSFTLDQDLFLFLLQKFKLSINNSAILTRFKNKSFAIIRKRK